MGCVNCNRNDVIIKHRRKWNGWCDDCIKEHLRDYGRKHYHEHKRHNKSIIYKIDFNDGDFYIGSSVQILKERVRLHFSHAFNDKSDMKISKKIRDRFNNSLDYNQLMKLCSIIEEVNEDIRHERERYWVELLKPNLNTVYTKKKVKVKEPNHKKGENHPNSKLTKDNVIEIRNLHKQKVSQIKIARLFNVSFMTINQIVNFRTWKEL